jgi:putative sterol carrier protein
VAPKAQITLKLETDQPIEVEFGESKLRPAAILAMPGDTAQGFWLGEVNIITALAQGKMKAQGPVAVILKLVPLVNVVAPLYRAQQEGGGESDAVAEEAVAEEDVLEEAAAEEAPQS